MILSQDLCFISSWITKRRQEERRVTSTPTRHMWFKIQISFKFYFSWIKWWSHPKWQLKKQVLNILLFEKNHNLSKKWSFQSIQMLMSDPLQSSAKVSSGGLFFNLDAYQTRYLCDLCFCMAIFMYFCMEILLAF